MLKEQNWKLDAALRLAFGVVLCVGLGSFISLLLRGKAGPDAPVNILQMMAGTLVVQLGALAMLWRFVREHHTTWQDAFGFRNGFPGVLKLILIAAGIVLPLVWGIQLFSLQLLSLLGIEPGEQYALVVLRQSASLPEIVLMGMVTIILAPIVEELLFRGVFYPFLKQLGWPRGALWGSAGLFALIHFNLGVFLPLLVLALILVWLYEKTENLLAPIGVHIIFNGVNFALFFFINSSAGKIPGQT